MIQRLDAGGGEVGLLVDTKDTTAATRFTYASSRVLESGDGVYGLDVGTGL
jgi:hypothetical protein